MIIKQVTMQTNALSQMRAFYTEVLPFDLLASDSESFTVRAGDTDLTFTQTSDDVLYHFAFVMREELMDQTLAHPAVQATLLPNKHGVPEFYSDLWDRPHHYFEDP